jgi:hypothetical protein
MYPCLSCKEAVTTPSGKPFTMEKVLKNGFAYCAMEAPYQKRKAMNNNFRIAEIQNLKG